MITRTAKLLLLVGIGLFYSLVVFNNVTDFDSNYEFVHHVLAMDSTFREPWHVARIPSPAVHLRFTSASFRGKIATTILLWWGVVLLFRALLLPAKAFNAARACR